MEVYTDSIIDNLGNTISGVTVTVKDTSGNIVDIFVDRDGTAKANPFTVGVDGLIQFSAADGSYDINISGVFNSININENIQISLFDPGLDNVVASNVKYLTTSDSPYTMASTDLLVIIKADTGDFTFNFLAANTPAIELNTYKIQRARDDLGTYNVNLVPYAGDTLGLGGSFSLLVGEWNEFKPNGITDYLIF